MRRSVLVIGRSSDPGRAETMLARCGASYICVEDLEAARALLGAQPHRRVAIARAQMLGSPVAFKAWLRKSKGLRIVLAGAPAGAGAGGRAAP